MDTLLKHRFLEAWNRYFPTAEPPLVFYYTNDEGRGEPPERTGNSHCIICQLAQARAGQPLAFDVDHVGCGGGKRFLGFAPQIRPNFEYFLSCGIPGQMEGERYKKSPALVTEMLKNQESFIAPGRFIVFKRWDTLQEEDDEPIAAIFFATADVLSGLFTLVNYDRADPNGVITPFGSGCSSIVYWPYQEAQQKEPRAVLGMFDVSARPCVQAEVLTLTVPLGRLQAMVDNVDESFLITGSWDKVRARIGQGGRQLEVQRLEVGETDLGL